jgi:hypothetical protein
MKFNRFIFDNYLETDNGKEGIYFFTEFWTLFENNNVDYIYDFFQKQYLQTIERENIETYIKLINEKIEAEKTRVTLENERIKINSIDAAEEYFNSFIKELIQDSPEIKTRELLPLIESISMHLNFIKPDYFFPYFFVDHFFKLEAIFSEFDIPLPQIPSKTKHEERLFYYF